MFPHEVERREIFRTLVRSGAMVIGVFVLGVVGYAVIGAGEYSLIDALYMTVITLTTVGYGEIIDLSDNPAGRLFTVVLLVLGVGAFLSFVSALTAFFVEGTAHHLLWKSRMQRHISKLNQHIILCGGGHTGAHVVRELLDTRRPFVLIEENEDRAHELLDHMGVEFPIIIGDATEDDCLLDAGIERATCLVACVSNDKDNLIITVSARLLRPTLRIVCRCINEGVEAKIHKAGADAVVSPNKIGGLRMISEAVRPAAVTLLDQMLRDRERGLRVESTEVKAGAPLSGRTIQALRDDPRLHGVVVLALRHGETWEYAPTLDKVLEPGMSLVYMCEPDRRSSIETLAG